MDENTMRAMRARYAYPPGRLDIAKRNDVVFLDIDGRRLCVVAPSTADWTRPEVRARHSSIALDQFHTDLLMSECTVDQRHGLLSCVTWGFISGTDLRIKPERAFGRARSLITGAGTRRPQGRDDVLRQLGGAQVAARDGDLAGALRACLQIKFIGPAFATKLVMMMRPDIAAVLDSVINERCHNHANPALAAIHGRMTLPTASANENFVSRYLQWCAWCTRHAAALNAQQARWTDWDGTEHPWRGVDIERAFFAMGRD
jgi:hypothetical protein